MTTHDGHGCARLSDYIAELERRRTATQRDLDDATAKYLGARAFALAAGGALPSRGRVTTTEEALAYIVTEIRTAKANLERRTAGHAPAMETR